MAHLRDITIISGGQTGADRAALDFAIGHGIRHGGWCPQGRLAEDGPLSPRYELRETPSRKYSQRTEWNVRDSDATVIFTIGPRAVGGTALAIACAQRLGKPWLHLARDTSAAAGGSDTATTSSAPLSPEQHAARLLAFLEQHQVRRLNVAGPRASQEPEIADFVQHVLQSALLASA